MKKLLLFLLLIISAKVDAQNFQCLQAGVKRYFTNDDGYLRGMRIDSVQTQGSNTVYYPFHTLRGVYDQSNTMYNVLLDTNGGSWLGKNVIQHSDGTFVFDNLWNDSTIIKSKANVGDSWIFYHDTANIYYLATVTEIDSMTVLGTIDSVKKILLHVYNGTSINYSHPLNNYEIFIAKNHGFVKIFDLYTFPYHQPDTTYPINNYWYGSGYDYYLDNVGVKQFSLVNFINPTERQLFNYDIGDIYEHQSTPPAYPTYGYYSLPDIEIDTIINKTILADSTVYLTNTGGYGANYSLNIGWNYSYSSYNRTLRFHDTYLFDTVKMPEEISINTHYFYFYIPNDTSYCYSSPIYKMYSNYIYGHYVQYPFEQPGDHSIYKTGLGRLEYENYFDPGDCPGCKESDYLTFYHKTTKNCGNYHTYLTVIDKIEGAGNDKRIYPNPANDLIHIDFNKQESCTVSITNMMGQVILSRQYNSKETIITTSDMPAGIYDVRIQTEDSAVSHQKIVVQH